MIRLTTATCRLCKFTVDSREGPEAAQAKLRALGCDHEPRLGVVITTAEALELESAGYGKQRAS